MDTGSKDIARSGKRQQICQDSNKKAADTGAPGVSHAPSHDHENPYLGRFDNGPYHLGHLLRDYSIPRHLTDETADIAKAVRTHAENGVMTLMHGIGVIGAMMIRVGSATSEGGDLQWNDVLSLGDLIQHLSGELRFLRELEGSMGDALHEREIRLAKGGAK